MHSNACCETWMIFQENYVTNFQKNEVFFIKGIAGDLYEYGRHIEIIEDLKGNLAGESSIFVWGDGCPSSDIPCMMTRRLDNMSLYNENDTLIMLITRAEKRFDEDIETSSDYATFECAFSVLKLSNVFVTVCAYPRLLPDLCEEITVSWEELYEELLNHTAIQTVKTNNNIYQWNGTIFFENPENKVIKISFYDLSGRLVHEAITASNSYRPVLTGSVFVCKINVNDELRTIKYIVP